MAGGGTSWGSYLHEPVKRICVCIDLIAAWGDGHCKGEGGIEGAQGLGRVGKVKIFKVQDSGLYSGQVLSAVRILSPQKPGKPHPPWSDFKGTGLCLSERAQWCDPYS